MTGNSEIKRMTSERRAKIERMTTKELLAHNRFNIVLGMKTEADLYVLTLLNRRLEKLSCCQRRVISEEVGWNKMDYDKIQNRKFGGG